MPLEAESETPCVPDLGGQDTRGGATEARMDFLRRLDLYSKAKSHTLGLAQSLGVARMLQMGITFPHRVLECGDWLRFRDYFTLKERDRIKLAAANFCGYPLICGFCARTRAGRNARAYVERFEAVVAERPKLHPYLVTLTVKNGEDLRERFDHLRESFRLLLERRTRHGSRDPSTVLHRVAGGVFSYELTNIGNGWHPHIHALWLYEPWAISHDELSEEWLAIAGDSFITDMRAADHDPRAVELGLNQYAGAFRECLKYAMKAAELGPDLIEVAYPVLRGRRLLGSFGCFRGVKLADTGADDLAGLDDLPYIEFMGQFAGGDYKFSGEVTNV